MWWFLDGIVWQKLFAFGFLRLGARQFSATKSESRLEDKIFFGPFVSPYLHMAVTAAAVLTATATGATEPWAVVNEESRRNEELLYPRAVKLSIEFFRPRYNALLERAKAGQALALQKKLDDVSIGRGKIIAARLLFYFGIIFGLVGCVTAIVAATAHVSDGSRQVIVGGVALIAAIATLCTTVYHFMGAVALPKEVSDYVISRDMATYEELVMQIDNMVAAVEWDPLVRQMSPLNKLITRVFAAENHYGVHPSALPPKQLSV